VHSTRSRTIDDRDNRSLEQICAANSATIEEQGQAAIARRKALPTADTRPRPVSATDAAAQVNLEQEPGCLVNPNNNQGMGQQVVDAQALAALLHGMQRPVGIKTVNSRDLPTFSGQLHEDCEEFLLKFEACAQAHNWDDDDTKRHFVLACQKNALKWYDTHKLLIWPALRDSFRETFGKSKVDFDIAGETGRMLVSEDPISYIYRILSYVKSTNPNATQEDKVARLFVACPPT
jgi:hypothetical protein